MELVDPSTGQALPGDTIQRPLFICGKVHVYRIPPLTSMQGHNASSWTADPERHIFTARMRVIETSSDSMPTPKIDVLLEDPSNGQLFAAAPYTSQADVEAAMDSSRFFAVTVRDPQGHKAVLGIGFEDRSEAFDMSVALQEARRGLGLETGATRKPAEPERPVKDYSLKEGETITVNIGGKTGRRRPTAAAETPASDAATLQSFALPPPSAAPSIGLAPPPSADDVKRKRRSLRDLGFDDGQFGEFA